MNKREMGGAMPEKKLPSFADLEKQEAVSAEELKEVLEDYASLGYGILAEVVKSIIDSNRERLTSNDLEKLRDSAQKGLTIQEKNNIHATPRTVKTEVNEYRNLIKYLEEQI